MSPSTAVRLEMPELEARTHGHWHWLVEHQGEVLECVLLTHHTEDFQELHPGRQGYRGVTVILGDADHAPDFGGDQFPDACPCAATAMELGQAPLGSKSGTVGFVHDHT